MNSNDTNMNGMGQGSPFNPNGLGNDATPSNVNPGMNGLEGMSLGNVEQPQSVMGTNTNVVPQSATEVSGTAPVGGGVTFSIPTVEPTTQNSSAPTMDMNFNSNGMTFGANMEPPVASNPSSVGETTIPDNSMNASNIGGMTSPTGMEPSNISGVNGSNFGTTITPDHNMNATPMMGDMNSNATSMNGMMNQPVSPMNMNASMGTDAIAPNGFVNNSMSNTPNMDVNTLNSFGQASNMGMNNNIMGSVPTPPIMNDFNNNPKPEKKGLSKPLILILVVVLIAIVGIGVYVVLNQTNLSKPKGNIIINDPITMPLGKELSTNVSDYATISGFDSTVCSLDLSKVDIKKMGSYDFTVSCGTTSRSGKIVLQDKEAPVVTAKEVTVAPGTNVTLEDFIVSCVDDSNCSYELSDSSKSLKEMASSVGVYDFDLIVSDDYNNSTVVQLTLNVTNNAPVKYMYCTQTATDADNMKASLETSYRYGINDEDALSQTQKIFNYIFETTADYNDAKEEFGTYSGDVTFNDEDLTISVTTDMTVDELSQEFNVSPFPTNYDDLKEFNLNQGISCKNR